MIDGQNFRIIEDEDILKACIANPLVPHAMYHQFAIT